MSGVDTEQPVLVQDAVSNEMATKVREDTKRILVVDDEQDRVILTDGTNDYLLELQE